VRYRHPTKDGFEERRATARIIAVEPADDLALLKIDVADKVATVALAPPEPVEMGETVTVIGSPGLGRVQLDTTMTTGIVSTPLRTLDGRPFLQASASVSPGNSGGPMMNEKGQVVGVVARKAAIQGVTFAVPGSRVLEFLRGACKDAAAN